MQRFAIQPGGIGFLALILSFASAYAVAYQISQRKPKLLIDEGRIGCIDGIRGYLALSVLAHHFLINWNFHYTQIWEPPDSTVFANLGPAAVIVFFMITAFLFYGKIVRSTATMNWRALFLGRIFRLVPLYLAVVLLIMLIAFWHQGFELLVTPLNLAKSIIAWLLFTLPGSPQIDDYERTRDVSAGVIWSLRYEWVFYFSLPILAFAVRNIAIARIRLLILIAVAAVLTLSGGVRLLDFEFKRLVPFCAGMVTYELTTIEPITCAARRKLFSVLIVLSILVALLFPGDPYAMGKVILLFLAFSAVAAGNNVFGILDLPASRLLGDASYSIYLLHGIVLHLGFGFSATALTSQSSLFWLALPIASAIVSAIAIASYRFIEAPFIDLGRRLSRPRRQETEIREIAR